MSINLESNQFSSKYSEQEAKDIQEMLSKNPEVEIPEGYTEHVKTSEDIETIKSWLDIASNKLKELGFSNPISSLPPIEKIILTDQPVDGDEAMNATGGIVTRDSNQVKYLRLDLHADSNVSLEENKRVFFHEIGHYIAISKIRRSIYEENDVVIDEGFQHRPDLPESAPVKERLEKGVWEEGLSEIFSAYCMERTIETTYPDQTAFFISFIEDYAEKARITNVEAFSNLFKDKSELNYDIQRALRDIYGTEFVKLLNTSKTFLGYSLPNAMVGIAKSGNFEHAYNTKILEINSDSGATFTGLKGIVKVSQNN